VTLGHLGPISRPTPRPTSQASDQPSAAKMSGTARQLDAHSIGLGAYHYFYPVVTMD